MIAFALKHVTGEADDDYRAAVERFNADLTIAAQPAASPGDASILRFLRRRALAAYRDALARAAGRPHDPRWRVLALSVATFVASLPSERSEAQRRAAARLQALVAETADAL